MIIMSESFKFILFQLIDHSNYTLFAKHSGIPRGDMTLKKRLSRVIKLIIPWEDIFA